MSIGNLGFELKEWYCQYQPTNSDPEEWYCQYQPTDSDTENYLSLAIKHYSITDKHKKVWFEGLYIHYHKYRSSTYEIRYI